MEALQEELRGSEYRGGTTSGTDRRECSGAAWSMMRKVQTYRIRDIAVACSTVLMRHHHWPAMDRFILASATSLTLGTLISRKCATR